MQLKQNIDRLATRKELSNITTKHLRIKSRQLPYKRRKRNLEEYKILDFKKSL